jgi:hypothetical protein
MEGTRILPSMADLDRRDWVQSSGFLAAIRRQTNNSEKANRTITFDQQLFPVGAHHAGDRRRPFSILPLLPT